MRISEKYDIQCSGWEWPHQTLTTPLWLTTSVRARSNDRKMILSGCHTILLLYVVNALVTHTRNPTVPGEPSSGHSLSSDIIVGKCILRAHESITPVDVQAYGGWWRQNRRIKAVQLPVNFGALPHYSLHPSCSHVPQYACYHLGSSVFGHLCGCWRCCKQYDCGFSLCWPQNQF